MKWPLVLVCSGRSWSGEQPGSACVCSPAREARPQAEAGHFPSEEFSPSRWLAACAGREWSRCGLGLGLEAAGAELRHPRAWLQAPAPPPTCATWPGTKLSEPGLLHEKFFLPERWLCDGQMQAHVMRVRPGTELHASCPLCRPSIPGLLLCRGRGGRSCPWCPLCSGHMLMGDVISPVVTEEKSVAHSYTAQEWARIGADTSPAS